MFCPKCGTQNPDDGKFCRSCGVDIGNVNLALSGDLKKDDWGWDASCSTSESKRRSDPDEVYGDGIKGIITGIGFFIVSMALFMTGVAGGRAWWWALLFPAFFGLSKGISDVLKSRRMSRSRAVGFAPPSGNMLGSTQTNASLPPPQTQFVAPESRYRTGDLVPPSVTDNTTRHLEMSNEGETMTLPKK